MSKLKCFDFWLTPTGIVYSINPLSIAGLLIPFLIGPYLEMFMCEANYDKALKLLHTQTCTWDYFFLRLFSLVQNMMHYSFDQLAGSSHGVYLYLGPPSRSWYLQAILDLLHGLLRMIQLVEEHKRPPESLIQDDPWDRAESEGEETWQLVLRQLLAEVVQPNAAGGHALAKSKFHFVLADVFAIKGLPSFHYAVNVGELQERKWLGSLWLLDFNVLCWIKNNQGKLWAIW